MGTMRIKTVHEGHNCADGHLPAERAGKGVEVSSVESMLDFHEGGLIEEGSDECE